MSHKCARTLQDDPRSRSSKRVYPGQSASRVDQATPTARVPTADSAVFTSPNEQPFCCRGVLSGIGDLSGTIRTPVTIVESGRCIALWHCIEHRNIENWYKYTYLVLLLVLNFTPKAREAALDVAASTLCCKTANLRMVDAEGDELLVRSPAPSLPTPVKEHGPSEARTNSHSTSGDAHASDGAGVNLDGTGSDDDHIDDHAIPGVCEEVCVRCCVHGGIPSSTATLYSAASLHLNNRKSIVLLGSHMPRNQAFAASRLHSCPACGPSLGHSNASTIVSAARSLSEEDQQQMRKVVRDSAEFSMALDFLETFEAVLKLTTEFTINSLEHELITSDGSQPGALRDLHMVSSSNRASSYSFDRPGHCCSLRHSP